MAILFCYRYIDGRERILAVLALSFIAVASARGETLNSNAARYRTVDLVLLRDPVNRPMLTDSRGARCLPDGKQRSLHAMPGCGLSRGRVVSPARAALKPAVAVCQAACGRVARLGPRVWPAPTRSRANKSSNVSSPAVTRTKASRASTATPAATSSSSPTHARPGTSHPSCHQKRVILYGEWVALSSFDAGMVRQMHYPQ